MRNLTRCRKSFWGTVFAALIALTARAIEVVVPNTNAVVEGNTYSAVPFGWDLQICRIQQVYDVSQFSLLGTNGGVINKICYRLGSGFFRPPSRIIHYPLTINLSTTSNTVGNLSTNFDQNTGADKTTVYSGTYNFWSLTGMGVVEPFGMVIPWRHHFFTIRRMAIFLWKR
jgi:hypothetical protein